MGDKVCTYECIIKEDWVGGQLLLSDLPSLLRSGKALPISGGKRASDKEGCKRGWRYGIPKGC